MALVGQPLEPNLTPRRGDGQWVAVTTARRQRQGDWEDLRREWTDYLAAKTDSELLVALNREVGNNGWVSIRGLFLGLLRRELSARFDLTAVGDLIHFPGKRKFALGGDRLVYADSAGPAVGFVARRVTQT